MTAACMVLSIPCSAQAEDVTGTWHLARVQGESGIISPKEAGLDWTVPGKKTEEPTGYKTMSWYSDALFLR